MTSTAKIDCSFYPEGAMRSWDELKALMTRCKETGESITLHCVHQMGEMTEFSLTDKAHFVKNDSFLPGYAIWQLRAGLEDEEGYEEYFCLGDLGISPDRGNCNEHRIFTDANLAEAYSNAMKSDPEYVAGVHKHWERCREFDSYIDSNDYSRDDFDVSEDQIEADHVLSSLSQAK